MPFHQVRYSPSNLIHKIVYMESMQWEYVFTEEHTASLRSVGMSTGKYNRCSGSQRWYQIFSCECVEEDIIFKECVPFVVLTAILKFSH